MAYLENKLKFFEGFNLVIPGEITMVTREGPAAVKEAIKYLKNAEPLDTLAWSSGLSRSCKDLVNDQGPKGDTGHTGSDDSSPFDRMNRYGKWGKVAAENLSYGQDDGTDVVMALFVDDGTSSRGHRENLFKDNITVAGGYSGDHKVFTEMTCINYAGSFENDDSVNPPSDAESVDTETGDAGTGGGG